MSTDLTTPKKAAPSLYDIITSKSTADKLRAQMATHVSPERLARVAWGAIMKTPKLLNATQESVLFCVAECARLGLEPSLGRVYFLPFDNNKKGVTECQIIIGYQGFLDLARRSGIVSSINARCVYENERFEYRVTIESPVLVHEPCLTGDKGTLLGAYCIARFKDGGSHVEYMTKSEIDAIRKRSKAANSGPWVTDYDAMALKTVVRRAAKFWPLTTASPELADAIQLSDDNEFIDVDFEPEKPKGTATERLSAALKEEEERSADGGVQAV
ncbi:MAG: recombinase RecT, partial [Planctomycetaceae bacterium]|nr:recombinase RecT [Planctomycetaceae bacterium]